MIYGVKISLSRLIPFDAGNMDGKMTNVRVARSVIFTTKTPGGRFAGFHRFFHIIASLFFAFRFGLALKGRITTPGTRMKQRKTEKYRNKNIKTERVTKMKNNISIEIQKWIFAGSSIEEHSIVQINNHFLWELLKSFMFCALVRPEILYRCCIGVDLQQWLDWSWTKRSFQLHCSWNQFLHMFPAKTYEKMFQLQLPMRLEIWDLTRR